ncbi:MAG: fumarylacetoacetate hydrolase family protein [Campylobacterales bacterium]|nr:fumarylacetoacetate hydrolase family protein [Campylobacterales bacterium]
MRTIVCNEETVTPSTLFCVGRNYVEHIKELGNETPESPVFFFKPNNVLAETLHVSMWDEAIHYETELVFVVGVDGYKAVGVGLDLTKRALQSTLKAKGLPWERAKSFRGAALVSPCLGFTCIEDLRLELWIDDVLVQEGGVSQMIYPPLEVLTQLQDFVDVSENDLVFTGTPKGVGVCHVGQVFVGKLFEKETLLVEQTWRVR